MAAVTDLRNPPVHFPLLSGKRITNVCPRLTRDQISGWVIQHGLTLSDTPVRGASRRYSLVDTVALQVMTLLIEMGERVPWAVALVNENRALLADLSGLPDPAERLHFFKVIELVFGAFVNAHSDISQTDEKVMRQVRNEVVARVAIDLGSLVAATRQAFIAELMASRSRVFTADGQPLTDND